MLQPAQRRLAGAVCRHPLLVVESFDPARFSGTMYEAANWSYVGNSKGYARSNGHYTDPHGKPKRIYVRALRDDAREILRQRGESGRCWQARRRSATKLTSAVCTGIAAGPGSPPWAGPPGGAGGALAMLSNMRGPGGRRVRAGARTGGTEAAGGVAQPRHGTLRAAHQIDHSPGGDGNRCRGAGSDAAALCDGARAGLRSAGATAALAADGKRIRGANRNGTMRYETATLVEHRTGVPVASLNFHDQNGELAAVGAWRWFRSVAR